MFKPLHLSTVFEEAEKRLVNSLLNEQDALEYFGILTKLKREHEQRALQLGIKLDMLQRRLLSLQRKRILSETPEEKRIRLLVIKTGLPEDEIRKGLELIGKD